MSVERGFNPHEEELKSKEIPKVEKTIAFVDASQDNDQRARDIAEAELLQEKEEINNERTWKNLVLRMWKNFKFSKKYEYARQKKIGEAKARMENTGSWYGTENTADDTQKELQATIDRFIAEAEGHTESRHGEQMQTIEEFFGPEQQSKAREIKDVVKELMSQYTTGALADKTAFVEARNRAFDQIEGLPDNLKNQVLGHADNMFRVAETARASFNHHQSLDNLDLDFDIVIAKARTGVRTKAELNTVDRIIDKIKGTKVGQYVDETTLASAIAIAYTAASTISQGIARSKVAAWATFGAGVLVSGGFAAARENKRIKEERALHARERAQGKNIKEGSKRREELENYTHKTIPAKEVAISMNELIKATGEYSRDEIQRLVSSVAEIDARIQMSDRENIDLIRYSDVKNVEQERLQLDIARAKVKAEIKRLHESGELVLPYQSNNWDEHYKQVVEAKSAYFAGEKEATDKQFNKFKAKKVAWSAVKAVGIGMVIGGVAQEARALVHPGETGLVEGMAGKNVEYATTPLEALRRWVSGADINKHALEGIGGGGGETTRMIIEGHQNLSPEEYLNQNPDVFHKIHRTLWYDNNTPKPVFDKNELKLWWGAEHNTGVNQNGDYVFDISHMKAKGSYHNQFDVDALKAMKEGKIKLLLSMSEKTQAQAVELEVGPNGEVIIPKESEAARLFFEMDSKGHAVFKGRYAEVAEMMGNKDGVDQVRLLATYEGKGIDGVPTDIISEHHLPKEGIGHIPDEVDYPIYPPPVIPIDSRRELESMGESRDLNQNNVVEDLDMDRWLDSKDYIQNYFNNSNEDEEYYKIRRSESLKNPEQKLDSKLEIEKYFSNLDKKWSDDIVELSKQIPEPIDKNCKVQIFIPVAGHQEGSNIYKTLEWYSRQKDKNGNKLDPSKFEILLFVNHPSDTEPDKTLLEINRFKADYPNLKIFYSYKKLNRDQAKIGTIRKFAADLALKRQIDGSVDQNDIILVSNDADSAGISGKYVDNLISQFEKNTKADALLGKIDWEPSAYVESPLLYVGTRLMQYLDSINRHPRNKVHKNIGSSGANFAYKSSIYAAVGGYFESDTKVEDVNLGKMIKASRRGSVTYPIVYGHANSLIYTNARRGVAAVNNGLAPSEQWDGQFGPDDSLRAKQWELPKAQKLTELLKNKEYINSLTKGLEDIINRTLLNSYRIKSDSQEAKKALGLLGVDYVSVKGKVKIKSIDKLLQQIQRYQEEGIKIYEDNLGLKNNEKKNFKNNEILQQVLELYPNVELEPKEYKKIPQSVREVGVHNFLLAMSTLFKVPNNIVIRLGSIHNVKKDEIVIDITKSEKQILQQLHSGIRRSNPNNWMTIKPIE